MKIKQKRNNNWFEIDLVSDTYTRTCTVKPVQKALEGTRTYDIYEQLHRFQVIYTIH